MILMIDNYDSFTYNIVHYLQELGEEVRVFRNDQISLKQIAALAPKQIVLSPGPCTPNEAGISLDLVKHFAQRLPLLGICLGHQSIGQCFGGRIVRAKRIMHGKTSLIHHQNQGIFSGIASPFRATRYHSLVIEQGSLPDCLEVSAWTQTKAGKIEEIMGIAHRDYPICGVQFHPESIMSESGHQLLQNFINII